MTWAQACARRLAQHSLVKPSTSMIEVAGHVCGVHAQIMSAAELALGLRVAGITRADVRSALWQERSLVKTFGPRGTVHLFPAHEWATWSSALAVAPRQKGSLPPALRMSGQQIDTLIEAIAASLEDAELTIDELDKEVVKHAGAWAGELVMPAFDGMWPRWRLIMTDAAYRGVLCFGPNRGRKVTYTNPRRLIPEFAPVDGEAALEEVVLRYLRTYGPATPQHFAQWLSITRSGAAKLFESLCDQLEEVELEGIPAFLPANDDEPAAAPGGLRLLPYFDAYSVGCHPRELVFPGRGGSEGCPGVRPARYR